MFLLKILCNLLERGKCFSIKFKNIFATLVDTSKLNGGLNQMILRFHFRLPLFCSKLNGGLNQMILRFHFRLALFCSKLNGGLNQMILRFRFRLALFCSKLNGGLNQMIWLLILLHY